MPNRFEYPYTEDSRIYEKCYYKAIGFVAKVLKRHPNITEQTLPYDTDLRKLVEELASLYYKIESG